jgi:aminopeptidase 2
MLASIVGEEAFLKGVSIYLKKRMFGNSITKDLWDGIIEVSGMNVPEIMEGWILKVGFPVITVEEFDNGRKLKVRQNRFLTTGDVLPEEDETLWLVPLALKTVTPTGEVFTNHEAILREREAIFDIGDGHARAFKLNAETVGVYRVAYSAERLLCLGEEASKSDTGFTVEDRIGLVSDAVTLAAAGHGRTSGALNLISKLWNEREMRVWESIAMCLDSLHTVWWEQPEDVRNAIDKFRIQLFRPVAQRLGWEFKHGEDPALVELRVLALQTLAESGDDATIAEMQRRFQPFLYSGDDSLIPADLKATIFRMVVQHGGEKEYRKMLEIYDDPPNPAMKVDAIWALCSTKEMPLFHETLDLITEGFILDQDVR